MRVLVLSGLFAMSMTAQAASAQDTAFPEVAMDDLMRVTMAQTADQKCDGISARGMRVQGAMLTMLQTVKKAGVDPVAAVEYLKTPEAEARIAARTKVLREKHGVAAEGDDALCAAIRAEAKEDKDLARLMRIR